MDIGVASPNAHGQAMMRTATALTRPVYPARLWPEESPGKERKDSNGHHRDHEHARHLVRHPLHRCFGPLRLGNHLHNLRQDGLRAHPLGFDDQAAGGIHRRANGVVTHPLGHRNRLARNHGLINRTCTLDDHAINGHLLARADTETVTHVYVSQRNVFLATVWVDATRCFRRQTEKRLDGGRRLRPRPELKHLSSQSQRDDDCGRFEVHANAAMLNERFGEYAGRDSRDNAVDVSSTGAEPDKSPHVWAAMDKGPDAALEERVPRPKHNGRRQDQFDPTLCGRCHPAKTVPKHGQD